MYKGFIKQHLAIFSILCIVLLFQVGSGQADQAGAKYSLNDIEAVVLDDSLTVSFQGDSLPVYTTRELFDPYRLIIDIGDLNFSEQIDTEKLIPDNKFASLNTTIVKELTPVITRFVFTITEGYRQIVKTEGNNLIVVIESLPNTQKSPVVSAGLEKIEDRASAKKADSSMPDEIVKKLLEAPPSSGFQGEPTSASASENVEKNFDLSGYQKNKITIDFYKMDIHNVFRLFREVSGLNIIVDEEVSGSVTLALNDVPWDFALDVVLNLSELVKEERYNTIIIYPKDKEIEWPKKTGANLSFRANLDIVEQEALVIEQSANQPKEVQQAKELMRSAKVEERDSNFEEAADLYEKAVELWPTNTNLSTRLAALYLVRLGMNAKAVFFAKKSLDQEQNDYKAALYAAIGMANMNRIPEAVEYFSRSISGEPPMKEALASFAAFSESNGRPAAALKLYDRYHEIYGESVNTMIAKARIYDSLDIEHKAISQYKAILSSGFRVSPDLRKYIQSRIAQKK